MTRDDLRAALDRLGLSLVALARMMGQTAITVSRWLAPGHLGSVRAVPAWLPSWLAMYERLTPEQRGEIWPGASTERHPAVAAKVQVYGTTLE